MVLGAEATWWNQEIGKIDFLRRLIQLMEHFLDGGWLVRGSDEGFYGGDTGDGVVKEDCGCCSLAAFLGGEWY
jgi:hypothetical protein